MTPESFRNSPTLCQELKDIVDSRAFKLGVAAVLNKFIGMDAPTASHPVVSSRMLTERTSYERAFQELADLPEAVVPPTPDTPDDWGDPAAAAKLAGADLGEPYAGPQNPT